MDTIYRLNKGTIAKYIRGECSRRLRLDLYSGKPARQIAGAPEKQSNRPGLTLLADQGRKYERLCFASLKDIFGADRVRHGAVKPFKPGETEAFEDIPLSDCLDHLSIAGRFAFEAQYPVLEPFLRAHNLHSLTQGVNAKLGFGENRPDILLSVAPDGEKTRRAVTPEGDIVKIPPDDDRMGIFIIDVKLSSEPSPAHFAELAYYGMTLAAWLKASGREEDFVVLADAAIWPGSHDGSAIRAKQAVDRARGIHVANPDDYYNVLSSDLEEMPAEVILGRVTRFLSHDLPLAMDGDDWKAKPYHIDGRCIGCDYLGYNWKAWEVEGDPVKLPDPDLCWPTAEREEHLSRLAGLTEGACGKLAESNVSSVPQLVPLKPTNKIFESHQALKAARHIVHARAKALRSGAPAELPPRSGSSAIMPAYSDIQIAISVDYDVGSGLAFALGYKLDTRKNWVVDCASTATVGQCQRLVGLSARI